MYVVIVVVENKLVRNMRDLVDPRPSLALASNWSDLRVSFSSLDDFHKLFVHNSRSFVFIAFSKMEIYLFIH